MKEKNKYTKTINWKQFYRNVFALVIPIAIQNLINVGVTATDVIMLGKVGEKVLSGASLAGQIQYIMTLIFYGVTSGATVLTAQYWGKKVNIHIIQCDDQVQTDQKITCEEELKEYMDKLELKGEGGTDFRPAFSYVDELVRQHTFEHLRGMIYFTDGRGIYPAKRPVYETAFVFMEEDYEDVDVPPWAIKIILEEDRDF